MAISIDNIKFVFAALSNFSELVDRAVVVGLRAAVYFADPVGGRRMKIVDLKFLFIFGLGGGEDGVEVVDVGEGRGCAGVVFGVVGGVAELVVLHSYFSNKIYRVILVILMFVNICCTTVYCPLNIRVDYIDVSLFSNFINIFFFID